MKFSPQPVAARGLRVVLALAAVASTGLAQNYVFVGTSVGGSTDPYYVVDSTLQTLPYSGGVTQTDNVTDAVWAHFGNDLYVSLSIANSVSRGDFSAGAPSWSTFYAAGGACYGLGFDSARELLYTLTGPSGSARELVAIDTNVANATYGQAVATSTSLSGISRERWGMSASGNLAAVPSAFLQGGSLDIVDTDPQSATYLQVIATSLVPGTSAGFTIATAAAITPDDQYALVLYTGIGLQGIARYHIPSGTWVDHDLFSTGVQNIDLPMSTPNGMDLARDGSFVVVSGGGSTNGWAARVDFDLLTPSNWSFTPYLSGQGLLANAYGASLSSDDTRAAFTSTGASKLIIVDTQSGLLLGNIGLPGGSNLYTCEWRDFCAAPAHYCTAGTTTNGCTATMSSTGIASATQSSGFVLTMSGVEGQKQGILFYGISGRAAVPWGSGGSSYLCVKSPTQRMGTQNSGGTLNQCNGSLSVDWSAFVATHPGALGTPFSVGDVVDAQGWFRDPPAVKTTSLSDALEFTLCP